jgi:hypothetical protein
MRGNIHRELTYQLIQAYPNKDLLELLLLSMAKPDLLYSRENAWLGISSRRGI